VGAGFPLRQRRRWGQHFGYPLGLGGDFVANRIWVYYSFYGYFIFRHVNAHPFHSCINRSFTGDQLLNIKLPTLFKWLHKRAPLILIIHFSIFFAHPLQWRSTNNTIGGQGQGLASSNFISSTFASSCCCCCWAHSIRYNQTKENKILMRNDTHHLNSFFAHLGNVGSTVSN